MASLSQHLSQNFRSVYVSSLVNADVHVSGGACIGTLKDLVALGEEQPRIIAGLVRGKDGQSRILDWEGFTIGEEDHKYQVVCRSVTEVQPPPNAIYLNRHILDKQIVDINDKKVVRVNDIRLAFVSGGVFPIAVDVGLAGLLRRLGVVETAGSIFRFFRRPMPGKLILWQDIGVLAVDSRNIKLSVTYAKLHTLHPSDLSDIIEDLDSKTRTAVFTSLDNEKAADVLEEMEHEAKVGLVEEMPVERAADVLEKMPSDEVADILEVIEEGKSEQLLEEMDKATSQEVRELMRYEENTVGSIMTTDYASFPSGFTPAQILEQLRKTKPEADSIYSIYAVDQAGKLSGEVSLRDLVTYELDLPIETFMNKRPVSVKDTDKLEKLMKIVSKYSPLAVPVVSKEKELKGIIVIDDIVYQVLRRKRPRL